MFLKRLVANFAAACAAVTLMCVPKAQPRGVQGAVLLRQRLGPRSDFAKELELKYDEMEAGVLARWNNGKNAIGQCCRQADLRWAFIRSMKGDDGTPMRGPIIGVDI